MGKIASAKTQKAHPHHSDRADLGGENPIGDIGQLIALILFIIVICLDNFVFYWWPQIHNLLPAIWALILGLPVVIWGGYIALRCYEKVFKEVRDPPRVITEDFFRYSRHPMYLGVLLIYLGVVIASMSVVGLFSLSVIFLFYDFISRWEEKRLLLKFGTEYQTYMEHVHRWVGCKKMKKKGM
jgi:protein-S-isoprenylcysteine O-methyltransferase Ste14